ncbi:hypothetical protein CPJCM30710_00600 [Clostridium polyendosporum]|uniref:Microcin J25-processing protein McjB C-terminal domain-containing protein n=1 Tax=Clostridium polyendosporum TaxID=69208 RepID=A0A919RX50_9CLOT|nr:lasso peptide biosynthesis B2 protein [Clostridium polyendosporum]GIM27394.1 hypothetical protein CPJCM30710_00600 [Clostridium polyendosporum]
MSWGEKFLFFEAFILTGISRMAILYIPFKRVKRYMGSYNVESPFEVENSVYETTKKVKCAVLRASKYTPWESKCLVQALTVQRMLKKRKISSTIYLGVNKDKGDKMQAHAWCRVGELTITGGELKQYFTQVAKFSN